MREISFNIGALLGAVGVRVGVGALWYSPLLFLKPWMKMAGITERQMQAGFAKAIVVDIIGSFVLAFVLLHAIKYALPADRQTDLGLGLAVSFLNWLGFVATIGLGSVTYEGKPMKYFWINAGYQLVTFLGAGVILTLWGGQVR